MDWYGAAYGNSLVVRNMGSPGSAGGSIVTGTWYNVLLIRDSSNVVKLYVDGSQAEAIAALRELLHFHGSELGQPAGGSGAGGTFFNGHLDEIAFWDSDQTSNLAAIYNSGVALIYGR